MSDLMPKPPSQPTTSELGPLFEERQKIHPRNVKGFYRNLKSALLWVGLLMYHFTPWLRWDRGEGNPGQAILFDIQKGRIYLLDLEIWPQDIYILTGLMILAAIGLFFSAALWGRAWCGFACFQTLWTDLFMKVEAWVEGDRNARIRLDNAPMSLKKFLKRGLKHTIWLLISAGVALSFLWYFGDARAVTIDVFTANLSGWETATFGTLLSMTYIMAGFAREQVCLYMCPYGRFQGVMFDQHSKVIAYEEWRGEPRQKAAKASELPDSGDCIDCSLCVQVCPTGIDIREGQQMGCIGCGLCIDACNIVMEKLKLPLNLISYDSQFNLSQREEKKVLPLQKQSRAMRPRTVVYAVILLLTLGISVMGFHLRELTELSVLKDRAPFYVSLSSGQIQNAYTVRVLNKDVIDKTFKLSVLGLDHSDIRIIGQGTQGIFVAAGSIKTLRLIVKAQPNEENTPLDIRVRDLDSNELKVTETVFHGPS